MKLRRIMAAVMACSIVCGAPAAMGTYQPSYELTANAVDIVESGKLGDNISWQYDSEGTLTISGKGDMPSLSSVEYDDGSAILSPWNYQTQMCKDVKKLIVKEGITSISHGAFNPMHHLESIELHNGLERIEEGAFGWTGFPKNVEIPESVVRIDERAFFQAHLLSITINNPNCEIYDDISTFADQDYETWEYDSLPTIYGYKGSTAEAYAEKYGYEFKEIGSETTTTTTTGTTTESTSTTTESTTTTLPLEQRIIGTWEFDHFIPSEDAETDEYPYNKLTMKINSDGTASLKTIDAQWEQTWTVEDGVITIGGATYRFINDNELEFIRFNGSAFFNRVTSDNALGDPNGDSKIDAKDASFVLVEYSLLSTGGKSSLTEKARTAADVNKDSKVDSKDASVLLQYYSYTSTGGTDTIEKYLGYSESTVNTTPSNATTTTASTATNSLLLAMSVPKRQNNTSVFFPN